MFADVDPILLKDHLDWVRRTVVAQKRFVAVYGAVNSGKTATFRAVAASQPYDEVVVFYWDLAPIDRSLRSADRFWAAFGEVLGVDAPGTLTDEDDIEEFIELAIAEVPGGDRPIMLVLDHWDLALDDRLDRIDQIAQDQMRSCLLNRHENRQPGEREFRLVALVESPNPDAFVAWAREREAQSAGLQALSKILERRFEAARMPFLSSRAAQDILITAGFDRAEAEHYAKFTGGWLGLLAAVQDARVTGRDIEEATADEASNLLAKATWPAVRRAFPAYSEEAEAAWMARVINAMLETTDPADKLGFYGFPVSQVSGGRVEPVGAVARVLPQPRFMFIDLENFLFSVAGEEKRCRVLRLIAKRLQVPTEHMYIFARNDRRATELLGPTRRRWTIVTTNLPDNLKVRKGEAEEADNSDDVVLAAWFAHIASRHPFAHLNVISGDNDFWGALSQLVGPGHRVIQVVKEGGNGFLSGHASDWQIDDETQPWAIAQVEGRRG